MTSRKFFTASGFLFFSVLFLGACNNEEKVTDTVTEEAADYEGVEDANPGGGLEEENIGGKVFGFTDFELEVDYNDQDDALMASYEEDRDQVEAAYEDKSSDEILAGNDALYKIEPLLAQLELTADMADEDVISKVTEAFSIETDFKSINIDVTYPDGTDKEYEASGN